MGRNAFLGHDWPWLVSDLRFRGNLDVLAFAQNWVDVGGPDELTEVRSDWSHHDQVGFDESQEDVWVGLTFFGNQVVFLEVLKLEEDFLQDDLEFNFIVILGSFFDSLVDLVQEQFVPSIVLWCIFTQSFFWDGGLQIVLYPFLEDIQSHDS